MPALGEERSERTRKGSRETRSSRKPRLPLRSPMRSRLIHLRVAPAAVIMLCSSDCWKERMLNMRTASVHCLLVRLHRYVEVVSGEAFNRRRLLQHALKVAIQPQTKSVRSSFSVVSIHARDKTLRYVNRTRLD